MRRRVTTESGSVYEFDDEVKQIRRIRGAGANELRHDGQQHGYHKIWEPVVGEPFVYLHEFTARYTTPVVSIEEI